MSIEESAAADLQSILRLAIDFHRSGNFSRAEELYGQILARKPDNAEARHLLGLALLAQGRSSEAQVELARAVQGNEGSAEFRHHWGLALSAEGRHAEAMERFREALALDPSYADAHASLGVAQQSMGDIAEAKASYRRALALRPRDVTAQFNLATALQHEGSFAEAEAGYRAVLTSADRHLEARQALGQCLQMQGRYLEAAACYQKALEQNPHSAALHAYLGSAWQAVGQMGKAADSFRAAVRLDPSHVEALGALGAAAQSLGRLDEAIACYRRVLELKSGDLAGQFNLATALYADSRYAEAEAAYRAVTTADGGHVAALCGLSKACLMQGRVLAAKDCAEQAVRAKPDDTEARLMRGTLLLTLGDWSPGWRDLKYCLQQREYRLHLGSAENESLHGPVWDESPLGTRTVLVHGEYGLGDTLHFVRYLPLVRRWAPESRIVIGVHPRLVPLLAESGFGKLGRLAALDGPLPPFDARVGMMSLPGIFGTMPDDVPAAGPYLAASPTLIEAWRQRLGGIKGLRIGIHWQGDSTFSSDRHRSMKLASFAPLAQVPGVSLISLQKGPGAHQAAEVARDFEVMVLDGLDEQAGAFMDTAAVMKNLDLVISSDSAVAHLAGALGVPVWLLLSAAPDWRWMVDRDDSPWYPSMRLFRQTTLDDWSAVFEQVATELARRAARL